MLAFVKRRLVVVAAGLALMALFIWYAGPFIRFGEGGIAPLASPLARVVAILIVGAWWGVVQWLKQRRARQAGSQLAAAVVSQARAEQPNADAARLREQFEDAIRTLKQNRRGAHSLYELPWYVIIGAPGSGKTTALVNSGLHFPLEQRVGKGALRGVGGTRNCDWWFTDEAIFLDTAGRYTTQDSDAAADSAGWSEFLSLLKKYRGRRPINGILLAISAQDLMLEGEREREAHVAAVRRRLDELNRELRVQLPVYLMVTKCDLLAGFSEYFDDQTQEGRAQVWGVTFPHGQSVSGQAPAAFPVEFDALVSRLNERVFGRVDEERDARRRPKIFGFPQQVAALRGSLSDFVASVFASTRFDKALLLRGVYFTSGTQEGTPIDRLLGALGRRFGVAADGVAPGGKGKAYFIEHLLKQVLIPESGLAGISLRREAAQAAAQLAAYAAVAAVALVGVVVLANSYRNNRAFLQGVKAQTAEVQRMPPAAAGAPVEPVLRRLDAVHDVVAAADTFREDVSWWSRGWGLDQSGTVRIRAFDVHAGDLDRALVPLLQTRLEQGMREHVANPDVLYEYLKAYLMLKPQGDVKVNASHLRAVAEIEWSRYATDSRASARLGAHFQELLDSGGISVVRLDDSLIAQARSSIRQASIPRLMYGFLKAKYGEDPRALRLAERLGGGADLFVRKRGIPLARPVDAIYTKAVFEEVAGKSSRELAEYFEEDAWVWGDARAIRSDAPDLAPQVMDLYEQDYIDHWDGLLADLALAPLPTLDRTKRALAVLGSSSSPLRSLLQVVQENTLLTKQDAAAAPADEGIGASVLKRLKGSAVSVPQPAQAGERITAHFAPIHRLLAGEGGSSALDRLIDQIRAVQQTMAKVGEGVGETSPNDPATIAEISRGADSLKQEAAGLPPAIGGIVTQLGDRAASVTSAGLRGVVARRYQQDVLSECLALIGTRYPFGTNSEVPVTDFGRVFGQGGVYDAFLRSQLLPLIDTTRSTWIWREGAGGGVPLLRFQEAELIQRIFFPGGGTAPEVRFTLTPQSVSSDRLVLEVDGKRLVYEHAGAPNWPIEWPGQRAAMVALTFEDRTGGGPSIEATGPWALLKLLERADIRAESDTTYLLTFEARGQQATVRLTADSSRNPWGMREWRRFRCA